METITSTITLLKKAYQLLVTAKSLSELYEENKNITGKYVHATSRGHEAIQIATGLQLLPQDYLSAYYRDDALLLAIGITPYELMLQLLAKRDDIFSGGRTYYSHPSLKREDLPKIPHQSSATGMQAIPTTGIAMGMQYKELEGLPTEDVKPITICSLGDASCTEGEVAEAFQMAALKQLPILYLVQDNEWDISASADEIRAQDIAHYAKGFKGLEVFSVDGTDFLASYEVVKKAIEIIRTERRPILIHAKVPLLNHHTSGVRKEWYRDDLEEAQSRDPYDKLKSMLLNEGVEIEEINQIEKEIADTVKIDYQNALKAGDPKPEDLYDHVFAPTPITEEKGNRSPEGKEKTVMVDSALFAIRELMAKHPEALLYGQDVGLRLGGVFREAATLAKQYGKNRVFNTPIQEAFIIGSTVGMSAVGLKPIVEVQFADYIWPGLNQLFTEVARSNYLSNGKWPVSMILRVPIGAYGSGGPYHSSSVESILTNIKGIKIAYPSTGADLKGLMKSAYYDPNPVIMLEHKGLYWSKMKGTEEAATIEPDEEYVLPFGKAREVLVTDSSSEHNSVTIITYGMGVYWAKEAAKDFSNQIEIIDLRTLVPLDEETIFNSVKKHSRCIVLTEEAKQNSFAQSIAGLINENCFEFLDAPVRVLGAKDMPAIPLNSVLEEEMLPNSTKLKSLIKDILNY
ncbi:2-oxoisovalerate dehydrogenase E1 component [Chishuiella changwenlii]|uniref:3-methyl-2-oxobutanoate dehydrogenase (2-methylpropanoyl-transferring) n=1 Tax=Chishuiella changwenlii TaxID=1434701 RepID=A0A1M7CDZ2_9FLAO|nr:alpha-ketoacid dehydrogenase subunit alpha/beta [Chishuiella changwenlii]GGF06332.1 tungsten formylmethanofuran dehydrogenase subunit E [Chishuiella changwenlii]SHL65474.1 2-oxoisovalerate dehydrogenase E1 component [Chishuiella changwenlii]